MTTIILDIKKSLHIINGKYSLSDNKVLYFNIFNNDLVNISTTFFSILSSSRNVKIIVKVTLFLRSQITASVIFLFPKSLHSLST